MAFDGWADEVEEDAPLKISKEYAKAYNERKDREELTRASRILADEDELDEESSESESEDEGGELLTDQVSTKIFETLSKIKSKDPSIYDSKATFFNDKDFEATATQKGESVPPAAKAVKYKDFMRQTLLKEGADAIIKEEEDMEDMAKKNKKKKPKSVQEEQRELKAAILSAAHDDQDADDLFTLKSKTQEELQVEAKEFEDFLARESKKRPGHDADDVMANYWKADEDLDDNEQFLRDYILNKGWQESASLQAPTSREAGAREYGGEAVGEVPSSDDEKQLDEQDAFEAKYNFRFEMEEARQIQSHPRFVTEGTVRQRDDKRKRKRKELKERKEAEKVRRIEELKRLKNLKRQEIHRRLLQLQEVTGNDAKAIAKVDLDADFDPEEHDKQMAALLGEDYDNQAESLSSKELVKPPAGIDDLDVSKDAESIVDKQQRQGIKEEAGSAKGAKKKQIGSEAGEEDETGGGGDQDEWWLCDQCHRGIPAGKKRFDCTVCENYTLCIYCFRVRHHPHRFVRRRVPDNCEPPPDIKGRVEGGSVEEDKAWDEYYQLDYEDIIGGDLPTSFKYRKVKPDSYGLSVQDILTKGDKELNQVVSLKKLRPYREEIPGGDEDDSADEGNSSSRWQQRWRKDAGRVSSDQKAQGGDVRAAEEGRGIASGSQAKDKAKQQQKKQGQQQKGQHHAQGRGPARVVKPPKKPAGTSGGPLKVSKERLAAYNFGLDRRKEDHGSSKKTT